MDKLPNQQIAHPPAETRFCWPAVPKNCGLWLCSLGLLRKLGGSGSPGQLLQQQQTKMLEKVNINFDFCHLRL